MCVSGDEECVEVCRVPVLFEDCREVHQVDTDSLVYKLGEFVDYSGDFDGELFGCPLVQEII